MAPDSDLNSSFSDRVRFSELDPQGVVFYSRYFEYADAAIISYFRTNGIVPGENRGSDFQVKTTSAEYSRPLCMDDEFHAFVSVQNLGRTSVQFLVSVCERHSGEQCCAIEVLQVYVDLDTARSTAIPESLRRVLEAS